MVKQIFKNKKNFLNSLTDFLIVIIKIIVKGTLEVKKWEIILINK